MHKQHSVLYDALTDSFFVAQRNNNVDSIKFHVAKVKKQKEDKKLEENVKQFGLLFPIPNIFKVYKVTKTEYTNNKIAIYFTDTLRVYGHKYDYLIFSYALMIKLVEYGFTTTAVKYKKSRRLLRLDIDTKEESAMFNFYFSAYFFK